MSTGFRYSHRDITNLDIRHIYSGDLSPSTYRIRPPVFHEGIDYLERVQESMKRPKLSKLPGKSFEYNREYSIVLPRAPAFRRFSKSQVESVVNRLTTGKAEKEAGRKDEKARMASAPPDIVRSGKPATVHVASYQKKRLSQNDINDMVNRLFRSRTHITELRQREKAVVSPRATTPETKTGKNADQKKKDKTQSEAKS